MRVTLVFSAGMLAGMLIQRSSRWLPLAAEMMMAALSTEVEMMEPVCSAAKPDSLMILPRKRGQRCKPQIEITHFDRRNDPLLPFR